MAQNSDQTVFTISFDTVVVPHLDAAYRLALWLLGHEQDAQDAVQDGALRALRHLHTFAGGNARAWFLRIVRNRCYDMAGRRRLPLEAFSDDSPVADLSPDPEALLIHADNVTLIKEALNDLPPVLREVLALRELEDFSYREIAELLGVPVGTVMSRLSRARAAFRLAITRRAQECTMPC